MLVRDLLEQLKHFEPTDEVEFNFKNNIFSVETVIKQQGTDFVIAELNGKPTHAMHILVKGIIPEELKR